MKIKDLLEFNPEAELEIIMPNYLPFEGKLDLGWSHGPGESSDTRKETVKTVSIILGDFKENAGEA
jgi:hypothetical protein